MVATAKAWGSAETQDKADELQASVDTSPISSHPLFSVAAAKFNHMKQKSDDLDAPNLDELSATCDVKESVADCKQARDKVEDEEVYGKDSARKLGIKTGLGKRRSRSIAESECLLVVSKKSHSVQTATIDSVSDTG